MNSAIRSFREPFHVEVPGKWVLTGEHSVLRGVPAIALPHPEFRLSLSFRPDDGPDLRVLPSEEARRVVEELIASAREELDPAARARSEAPRGTLEIRSTIPIGAGLGSSAALCVAMARWLAGPLGIAPEATLDFATRLEHRFHGRSSGMDTAVIASNEPVAFVMGRGPQPLGVRRIPRFTFHDTGLRTRTSDCVARVSGLKQTDPGRAGRIDDAMSAASRLAMEGLVRYDAASPSDSAPALADVARAMREAQGCFREWELVPEPGQMLEESLLAQGALAVKMTGAGGGGMVVALWPDA